MVTGLEDVKHSADMYRTNMGLLAVHSAKTTPNITLVACHLITVSFTLLF